MKALITGAGGFAGRHLAQRLRSQEIDVVTASRSDCNLSDPDSVARLIQDVQPEQVYHLAAMTSEQDILKNPAAAFEVNVVGTENLLHAIADCAPQATVLLAGSSAEYGLAIDNPITEKTALKPVTLYGVSKLAQSLVGQRYWLNRGVIVIRTRAFNYAGPGQSEKFVVSSMCKKIAEIEQAGDSHVLKTGNLESYRDFTDVRDIVAAYQSAIEQGKPGDIYNIATGRAVSIRKLAEQLIELSNHEIELDAPSPEQTAKSDVPLQIGDASKISSETGWRPIILLEQTLLDTLNYWREKIRSNNG